MIYHFLVHTVDLKRGKLIDKLVSKDVISRTEKQVTKEWKKSEKEECLMIMLREKSDAEFESFLDALDETGQESVADVVRDALETVGETGQKSLLRHLYGKSNVIVFKIIINVSV